jgi:3-oxoadipate enol-lactonase/4-carboxymuconolactone decarboxylase
MRGYAESERFESAKRAYARLFPGVPLPDPDVSTPGLPPSGADFRQFIAEITLADSWERKALDDRSKSLITMAMLIALGGQTDELTRHFNAALNLGIDPDEIVDLHIHAAAYCGVPRAHTAFTVALEVLEQRAGRP